MPFGRQTSIPFRIAKMERDTQKKYARNHRACPSVRPSVRPAGRIIAGVRELERESDFSPIDDYRNKNRTRSLTSGVGLLGIRLCCYR